MRKFIPLLGLFLIFSSCSWFNKEQLEINPEHVVQPEVNLLQDGNLEQWDIMGNPEGWQIVEGVLRSEGGKGGNWLKSKDQYDDFILRLEYRISPEGNSGVFIRCQEEGNPWETGYECQISNEQPPRDDLHCTGSLYGYVPVRFRPDESPEVWHRYEIMCKGTRIMVWVDGLLTIDVDQSENEAIQDKPLQGYIGLQDAHSPEGTWVEFRNVRIREL